MKKIIAALGVLLSLNAWGIPTTPGTPVCSSSSATAISCTWTASTDGTGIANYRVERRIRDSGASFVEIAQRTVNDISDTVPNPVAYDYRVRAFSNGAEFSDYSATTFVAAPKSFPYNYGISIYQDYRFYTATDRDTLFDEIQNLNAKWVRIDITHSTVEDVEGIYNYTLYDAPISDLLSRGFKILAVIGNSPAWNRDASCTNSNARPLDQQAFADFAANVVARYPNIKAWEVVNEPNLIQSYCPGVDVANYTELLKKVYIAIKAVNPQVAVITGGTAPTTTSLPNSQSPIGFIQGIYSNGGKHYFDAYGHHPYSFPTAPSVAYSGGGGTGWQMFDQTPTDLRDVMSTNGDTHKQIWSTEWGAPTTGSPSVTQQQQADDYVIGGFTILAGKSWAGPAFWFTTRDFCSDTGNFNCWFGLLNQDWTHKLSFSAYQNLPIINDSVLSSPTNFHRDP